MVVNLVRCHETASPGSLGHSSSLAHALLLPPSPPSTRGDITEWELEKVWSCPRPAAETGAEPRHHPARRGVETEAGRETEVSPKVLSLGSEASTYAYLRYLCVAYALLYALLYVAHSRSTHGHDTGHRSHLGRLSHFRSDHAVVRTVTANRRNWGPPEALVKKQAAVLVTPACSRKLTETALPEPAATAPGPRTSEQQPPTAPATEAAHPAFPASRAVFRGCFSPC
ncbi:hypothetical protein NDU88_000762 [Pleurodeles waltl]|uniref:Uncharacterized protein n=1 Tax=Pleurodeles waltl TaxID=8319 RepID=A0AAV7V9Y7_PLEWA|nr:hypothetical protein NDU88_000762 [Pleurodeles waltl]